MVFSILNCLKEKQIDDDDDDKKNKSIIIIILKMKLKGWKTKNHQHRQQIKNNQLTLVFNYTHV